MSKQTAALDLEVDLEGGVVPISRAASALAALFKRARDQRKPIIVTQKGYPSAVLLSIELYTALRDLAGAPAAEGGAAQEGQPDGPPVAGEPPVASEAEPPVVTPPTPGPKPRGGRRRTSQS